MVTLWCSLRPGPNHVTRRTRGRLRAARRRCIALIRAPLDPTTHSMYRLCSTESYTTPLPLPPLALHRLSGAGGPLDHGILVD